MTAILIFLSIFTGLLLIPAAWRLKLSVWASIFQFYTLPVFGFYPSLAMIGNLSLAPNLLWWRRTLLQPPVFILLCLMGWQLVSISWSPDKKLGFATVLYEAPFIFLYISALHIAKKTPEKLLKLVKVYAIFSLVPLFLTVFFRLYYYLNIEFITSSVIHIFVNPNTVNWFLSQIRYEHLSQTLIHTDFSSFSFLNLDSGGISNKPRGFFLNPNVGGGYFGICAVLFWGVGVYCQSGWLKLISALHWLCLFLTMSIVAISLAFIIPALLLLFHQQQQKKYGIFLGSITSYLGLSITTLFIICSKPALLTFFIHKTQSRLIFWKVASAIFPGHLLLGFGFGGWYAHYDQYRSSAPSILLADGLPPHNTFIHLASQSGVLAVVLGLLFMLSVLYFCKRAYTQSVESKERTLVLCTTGGFLWMFLQGLSENWGVTGEMHMQAILATMFGLIMGLYYRTQASKS